MLTIQEIPKNITLAEFINKCDIPGVGTETSRKIAQEVKNIQTLRNMVEEGTLEESLSNVNGISTKVITYLAEKFSDIDWLLLLEDMEDAKYDMFVNSTNIIYSSEELEELRNSVFVGEDSIKNLPIDLKGQKICITGTLSLPRKMFQQMIEKNGGIFQSNVTSATDILIFSEKDGMSTVKYRMAEKLLSNGCSISMITEKIFIDKFSKKI